MCEIIVSVLISHNLHYSAILVTCCLFMAQFFTGWMSQGNVGVPRGNCPGGCKGLITVNLVARNGGESEYTQALWWHRFTASCDQMSWGCGYRSKASLHPERINLENNVLELLLDCLRKVSSWSQYRGIAKEKKKKQLIPD